jgi:DNA-binding response OmpR family regulator
MKTRYVIIDDDPGAIELLETEISHYSDFIIVQKFDNPDKFLHEQLTIRYDIVFLDINMPLNGIEISKKVHKQIVFVTAHRKEFSDGLLDLHNKNDNILGSINKARLGQELKAIIPKIRERVYALNKDLIIDTDRGKARIDFDDIILVASNHILKRQDDTNKKAKDDNPVLSEKDKMLIKISDFDRSVSECLWIKNKTIEDIFTLLNNDKMFFILNKYCIISRKFIKHLPSAEEVFMKLPPQCPIKVENPLTVSDSSKKKFEIWFDPYTAK